MAEALFQLSEDLTWSPTSAPQGEFVAINDTVDATGSFLVQHFAALFLKANHRVCFIACSNSKEHYAAVGRKLGVNFSLMIEKQKLQYVDFFAEDFSNMQIVDIFDNIRAFAGASTDDAPVSIVLDDLSAMKWAFGVDATIRFLRCCRALAHPKNGRANIVVLNHADTDPSSSSQEKSLNPALVEMASIVFSVTPLPTGYCKDVHGTLTVQRQLQTLDCLPRKLSIPYKILENTIRCFRSGGDALKSV